MLSGRVTGGALRKIAVACALVTAIGATVATGDSSNSSSSGSTSAPVSKSTGILTGGFEGCGSDRTTQSVRWKNPTLTLSQTIPGAGAGGAAVKANLTSEQLGYDVCPAGASVTIAVVALGGTSAPCQVVSSQLMVSNYGECRVRVSLNDNTAVFSDLSVLIVPLTSAEPTPTQDTTTAAPPASSTTPTAEWIQDPKVPLNLGVLLDPPAGTYSNGALSYELTGTSATKGSTCKIDSGKIIIYSLTEVCHVTQKVMTNGTASSSIPKDFRAYLVDAPPLTATFVVSGTEKDWFQVWSETQTLINSFSLLVNDTLVHPRQPFTWRTSWPLGKDDLVVTRTSGLCINLTRKDPEASNEWVDIFDPCIWSVTSKSLWLNQPVGTMRLIPRGVAIVTVTAPVSKISVGSSVELTSTVSVTDERVPFPASSPTWSTTSPACAVNASGVVTGKAEGPCDVYASYQKSEDYLADYQGYKKIFVDPLPQTVSWSPDTTPSLTASSGGGKQFSPAAATSSGSGAVTYAVASAGNTYCRIGSSSPLTVIVGADGTCSVTASAAATSTYAAGSTTVVFTISGFDTPAPVSGGGGTSNDDRGTYDCPTGTHAVWNGSRWYCELN